MAEPPGPFCVLGAGPGRYLCYCCPAAGPGSAGTVCVTDALEVWAGELGARPPQGRAPQGGTGLPEDGVAKLREALRRGAVSLSLQEGGATLQLQGEAGHSTLHLCKLPVAEARTQLQALMFGLATSIKKLEERLEVVGTLGSSCSPEKNASQSQQLFLPDPSPRKNRAAGSALSAKRKIPGESLINPGFKSKKAPSGVDFEDS
ncbi:protein PAXX isoform X8 [Anas platyrhynchos]|uniref:protein PAXX isoform X8 n=1 Tax=Anas platyrhynchos TaxID=8839 RepID=UPI0018D61D70|nr:protein PAXX isoform X8 [Anas platyrhynchos]